MEKRFLFAFGLQGAGKGEFTRIAKPLLKAASHRYSDPIRQFADLIGVPQDREPLQAIGQAARKIFGPPCWQEALVKLCEQSPNPNVIVDGAREPRDIEDHFLGHPAFWAINIERDQEKRCQGVMARDGVTRERFMEAEKHVNEVRIGETVALIRRVRPERLIDLDNNGETADLERAIIEAVLPRIR